MLNLKTKQTGSGREREEWTVTVCSSSRRWWRWRRPTERSSTSGRPQGGPRLMCQDAVITDNITGVSPKLYSTSFPPRSFPNVPQAGKKKNSHPPSPLPPPSSVGKKKKEGAIQVRNNDGNEWGEEEEEEEEEGAIPDLPPGGSRGFVWVSSGCRFRRT